MENDMKMIKLMWSDFIESIFYGKLEKFFIDFTKLFLILTPIGFVAIMVLSHLGQQVLVEGAPIIGWIIISFFLGFIVMGGAAAIFMISIFIFYSVVELPGLVKRILGYFKNLKDRVE